MAGGEGGLGFSTTAASPLPIPCTAEMPALPPAGLPVSTFPGSPAPDTHTPAGLPFHKHGSSHHSSSQPSFTSPGGSQNPLQNTSPGLRSPQRLPPPASPPGFSALPAPVHQTTYCPLITPSPGLQRALSHCSFSIRCRLPPCLQDHFLSVLQGQVLMHLLLGALPLPPHPSSSEDM